MLLCKCYLVEIQVFWDARRVSLGGWSPMTELRMILDPEDWRRYHPAQPLRPATHCIIPRRPAVRSAELEMLTRLLVMVLAIWLLTNLNILRSVLLWAKCGPSSVLHRIYSGLSSIGRGFQRVYRRRSCWPCHFCTLNIFHTKCDSWWRQSKITVLCQ
jgi:hypothetical protein